MRHVQLEHAPASTHYDELVFEDDRLNLLANEQPAPSADRADRESDWRTRRPEPRLLDPTEQPLTRLDAKSVAAEEMVWHDDCHFFIPDLRSRQSCV
jgi:hypothetical protein